MKKTLILLLVITFGLAGCSSWSNSRANPSNWFGGSKSVQADSAGTNPLVPTTNRKGLFSRPDPEDRSVPIETVTGLQVDPTLSGAIIYATGLAAELGAFDASLRPADPDGAPQDGVLSFTFSVVYPIERRPLGTPQSREVAVALSLSAKELEGVRVIRVTGRQNARESRRR